MPGLMVVIGANGNPMRKELRSMHNESKRAGDAIKKNIEGHGEIKSGVVRESIVLMREISAGNWTRVPGSLSLLLQRMGALKLLFTDLSAGGLTLGAGITIIGTVAAGVAIAVGILHARVGMLAKSLEGLKAADFTPSYIPKHLQAINSAIEGQKQINKEVARSIELYNSAASRAERVSEASRIHFEHLKKMNEYEKNPIVKAQRSLEIQRMEHQDELKNMTTEQFNLELQARGQRKQAEGINVPSKEHDQNVIGATEANAKEAEKFLKDHKQFGGFADTMKAGVGGYIPFIPSTEKVFHDMARADAERVKQAHDAIQSHKSAVDSSASNDELRERKKQLEKDAGESASKAATMALEIPRKAKQYKQEESNKVEEENAELSAGMKFHHGNVNELQKIGAYTPAAMQLDIGRKSLSHLKSIDDKIGKIVGFNGSRQGFGAVQH